MADNLPLQVWDGVSSPPTPSVSVPRAVQTYSKLGRWGLHALLAREVRSMAIRTALCHIDRSVV